MKNLSQSKSWSTCKQILCEKNLYFNIKLASNSGFPERFLETPTTPEIPTPQTTEFTDIYKSPKFTQFNNWLDCNENSDINKKDPLITFVNSRTNSRQLSIFPKEREQPKRILEDDTFKVLKLPPEDLKKHKQTVGYFQNTKGKKIIREFCALRKKSDGIYNCINSQSRPKVFLLQFIYQLLQNYHSSVQWIDEDSFTFKILNPQTLTKMWGQYKVNPKMTFDSLTRSLRLSYKSGKLIKIPKTKNTYKFTCINNFINM